MSAWTRGEEIFALYGYPKAATRRGHTPALLVAVEDVPKDMPCDLLIPIDTDTESVALVYQEDDARLIAAAPEMLELLRALAVLSLYGPGDPRDPSRGLAHEARALIDRIDPVQPWTDADQTAAEEEGWAIFNGNTIQRDDEMGAFATDEDAVRYVRARAKAGSNRHRRALRIAR